MARSVQRRESMLAGTKSEHDDEYRVSRPEHSEDRCGYTLTPWPPTALQAIIHIWFVAEKAARTVSHRCP
jgi:hypothetical protein